MGEGRDGGGMDGSSLPLLDIRRPVAIGGWIVEGGKLPVTCRSPAIGGWCGACIDIRLGFCGAACGEIPPGTGKIRGE